MRTQLLSAHDAIPPCPGWGDFESYEDTVRPADQPLHRVAFVARGPDGQEVTGSAAQPGESPRWRAYFELLERMSLVEALLTPRTWTVRNREGEAVGELDHQTLFPESTDPNRWRYALSNGVALHRDWQAACERAAWELLERDRILRAWFGWSVPRSRPVPAGVIPANLEAQYDWRVARMSGDGPGTSQGDHATMVFGFPRFEPWPLVWGHAARATEAEALTAAAHEALQRLAFVWGEPLPEGPPELQPTPYFHQEHYLYPPHHEAIRQWLRHGHGQYAHRAAEPGPVDPDSMWWVDLTPASLSGQVQVVKAVASGALPLVFGTPPQLGSHMPEKLRVHPIA
jgi:hypothetical protein